MFLIFLFLVAANIYAENDPLIQLTTVKTQVVLNEKFGFKPFKPFETFMVASLGEIPLLFYPTHPKDKHLNPEIHHLNLLFIPLKQSEQPYVFLEDLKKLAIQINNPMDYDKDRQKLFSKIYTAAAQLTETTLALIQSLKNHPNPSKLTKQLNTLFISWNNQLQNHELTFLQSLAIDGLKTDSSNLSQLEKAWPLAYNFVIAGTPDKTTTITKETLDFFEEHIKPTKIKLQKLKDTCEKITFFDRAYGKRYVILGLIITIPLALYALYHCAVLHIKNY